MPICKQSPSSTKPAMIAPIASSVALRGVTGKAASFSTNAVTS